jgi:hypothetical protein
VLLAHVYDGAVRYYEKVKGKVNAENLHALVRDLKGSALKAPIFEKLAVLRQKVLSDKYVEGELSTYIPVQGAYRIQDQNQFDLETEIHTFLSGEKTLLLLLGSAGGGKSTFNRYMERKLWDAYQPGDSIPLFIPLPSLRDPVNNLFNEVLEGYGFTSKEIEFLQKNYRFTLILDGYDEMNKLVNLYVRNHLQNWKAKIIIACRTQYLTRVPSYTGYFLPAAGERPNRQLFREMTVVPFSDEQISSYIRKYLDLHEDAQWRDPDEYERYIRIIPGLRELVGTPFLLMMAMRAMPDIVEKYASLGKEECRRMTRAKLYDVFIEQWFQRDEDRLICKGDLPEEGFEVQPLFWDFSKKLATKMYTANPKLTQVKYKPSNRLDLDQKESKEKEADPWEYFFGDKDKDVVRARRGCPLRPVGPYTYAFIHDSLVEYFFAKTIYDEAPENLLEGTAAVIAEVPVVQQKKRAVSDPDETSAPLTPSAPSHPSPIGSTALQVSAQAAQAQGNFAPSMRAANAQRPTSARQPSPASEVIIR